MPRASKDHGYVFPLMKCCDIDIHVQNYKIRGPVYVKVPPAIPALGKLRQEGQADSLGCMRPCIKKTEKGKVRG